MNPFPIDHAFRPRLRGRLTLADYLYPGNLRLSADRFFTWLYRDWETDRKSTRLNSSHSAKSRMPSSA